ncbi:hypothetical protein ElyMa_004398600 [Elysia marginata]|uniref:Uncharacterized protein n=1 Tax=Elysia marginata TaxID=1093978 RepID=A0AAV4H7R7_9GAST|nr:hypothetical protein ElyMa_004398600 [Elysia marginata]
MFFSKKVVLIFPFVLQCAGVLPGIQTSSWRYLAAEGLDLPGILRYLPEGTCATYRSCLAARGCTYGYPHRIDRPVVTSRPLRPSLYQSYNWSRKPCFPTFHVCLTRKVPRASSFPPFNCTIVRLSSLDIRCGI